MWWFVGIGGVLLYALLLFTLGLATLRNGHGWLFFLGSSSPCSGSSGRSRDPRIEEYA